MSKITHEKGNKEAWICKCGNTPSNEGFYPCNSEGEKVDPTPEEWNTKLYVCNKCGVMIDQDNLEIEGSTFLINGRVQYAS